MAKVFKIVRVHDRKMVSINTSDKQFGNCIEYKKGMVKAPEGSKLFTFESLATACKCLEKDWSASDYTFFIYECYTPQTFPAPARIGSPISTPRTSLWANGELNTKTVYSPTPEGTVLVESIVLKKRVMTYRPQGSKR